MKHRPKKNLPLGCDDEIEPQARVAITRHDQLFFSCLLVIANSAPEARCLLKEKSIITYLDSRRVKDILYIYFSDR